MNGSDELELVVKAKEFVADGVVRLVLVHPDGADLPEWSAGAHVDIVLGPELVRQYSLCGDVTDRGRYEVAVLREEFGRGGSRHVHDQLAEGDRVRVVGPRNNFELEPASRHLFIAGGVGITPILPMLAAAGEWALLYGGRSRSSMAFLPELLDRWGDAGSGGRVTVRPADEFGLLDLAGALDAIESDTLVYCCGPEPLLAAVEEHCAARGLSLRVERFAPKPVETAGPDEAFEVELASDGRVIEVPADRSVLDALLDAGVRMAFSCAEGTCGTCEVAVLAGEPDHRDSLLSEIERVQNKSMFVCVSRSRSPRLRLDI